jgi:hypothetical protein
VQSPLGVFDMPEVISDDLMIRIIDKGINTLGENSSRLLWSLLQNDYGLSKDEITKNLPAFLEALQKTFGLGYNFLDAILLTLLKQSTSESLEGYKSFSQYVAEWRNKTPLDIQK